MLRNEPSRDYPFIMTEVVANEARIARHGLHAGRLHAGD
jgi:hypothetical protein